MGTIYSCSNKYVIYLKNNYIGGVWLRFPYPQDANHCSMKPEESP